MPRNGRGTKLTRGWGKPSKGGAADRPSSAQNPPASGSSTTVAPAAAAAAVAGNNGNNYNNIAAAAAAVAGNNGNNYNNIAAAAASPVPTHDRPSSSQASASVRSTPAFLATPGRAHPTSRNKKAVDPRQEAEMRRIFRSGADQVLAKPPPRLNVTVHISWPGPMHGFKDIDPADIDVQTLLARIGKENDAKIEAEDLDTSVCVTVMAPNRAKAQEVIAVLRKVFLYRPGEESVWRSRILVNPPKNGTQCLTTILEPKEGSTGRRAIAMATENLGTVDEAGLIATRAAYKQSLVRILDEIAGHLRHEPNGMRMRVRFGTLVLDEWYKNKSEYNLAELETLVSRAGMRGTAHLLHPISSSTAKALANQFSPSNMELPKMVREFLKTEDEHDNGDPKVAYSVVLATKNLQVESEFENVTGQKQRQGHGVQYNVGSLKVHQLEKRHRSAEVITVCPESRYDWGIEICKTAVDQATKTSAPFDVKLLQNNLNFTGERLAVGFPNFKITDGFLRTHNIKGVHGKTTLQWTLGMKYTLEINLFHDQGQNKTLAARPTTASVVLLSPDWDDEMISGMSVPRKWHASFEEQFLKPGPYDRIPGDRTAEPLDYFLSWVSWTQKVLDSA